MAIYHKLNLTLFIVLLSFYSAIAGTKTWKKGILKDEFIFTEASFPSCHAATIAETPSGVVAAWFGGTHERNPDVCIWFSRLINGKWSVPENVANGIQNDSLRYPCWNPVLFQIPGGKLQLYYKIGPKPSDWWGMLIESSDNGKSWSAPVRLPDGIIGPVKNKPVLLDQHRLLCPSSTENNRWQIHFELTSDYGKTWIREADLNDGKVYQAIQPTVLVYNDGRLQALSRTENGVIASCWSDDQGKSWSLLQPSGLPGNNSGLDAVSLKNGWQLVVYNHIKSPQHSRKGYRTPLNVALSKDGKHWKAALILEDSEISQYSYPSVIQSSDGLVHIVYTWRRKRIKHVVVDPSKLHLKFIKNEQWPD